MKKLVFILLFLTVWNIKSKSQDIYGFAENIFCSFNLEDKSVDTLIVFPGLPGINAGFRSAIDRFNGRYFWGGSLPGHSGKFHIIDLIDLSINSFSVYPENIEYDFIKNRLLYEKTGTFYSLSLDDMTLNKMTNIENSGSDIYGQKRTYDPHNNQYVYIDYCDGYEEGIFYLVIDARSGDINCKVNAEFIDSLYYYSPGGLTTNILNGDIIGHRNGRYGIVNPCEGNMTKLSQIQDYHSRLNHQMAVFNNKDSTYIIPYYSTDTNNVYKIAVIDIYNDKILKTFNQPLKGKMNLQQIYDKSIAPLIYIYDTLFVPHGNNYKWFLNDSLIGETNVNYWIPTKSGRYKSQIEFREYTTFSTEVIVNLNSVKDKLKIKSLKIFPNPFSDYLNIENNTSNLSNVIIFDVNGKTIINMNEINSNRIVINTSELKNGIYFLLIKTKKNSYIKKIIKF